MNFDNVRFYPVHNKSSKRMNIKLYIRTTLVFETDRVLCISFASVNNHIHY